MNQTGYITIKIEKRLYDIIKLKTDLSPNQFIRKHLEAEGLVPPGQMKSEKESNTSEG